MKKLLITGFYRSGTSLLAQFLNMCGYNTGGSLVASTNATQVSNSGNSIMVDNQTYGAITPAGSFAMTVTSGSGNWTWAMVSFEPAASFEEISNSQIQIID